MSPVIFGIAFAVGAAALALWTDFRFARFAPEEPRGILIHTAISFALLHFVAGMVGPLVAAGPVSAMVTLLGLALPAVIYAFLVCVWVIKMFQGAIAKTR